MTKLYRLVIMVMCCSFFWSSALPVLAQEDGFDPSNPPEPAVIDFCKITVGADPEEGAYVSGAGKYKLTGGSIYISTSAKNTEDYTYTFQYWTLNGVKYTTSRNFYYTPQKGEKNFVAHYDKKEVVFDPASPQEPSGTTVKRKYMLYLTSNIENSCSFNIESGEKRIEGSSIYLRVYPSAYYKFEGWRVNGNIVSYSTSFYFTMPSANTTVEAILSEIPFDPENPIEPPSSGQGDIDNTDPSRQFVVLSIGTQGNEVDKTRVVFNDNKSVGYESECDASKFISSDALCQIYTINDGIRYQINERPVESGRVDVGIVLKDEGEYVISSSRMDCEAVLYDKILKVEHNLALGGYAFTSAAGSIENRFELRVPAKTIRGDANGDGVVNILDVLAVLSIIKGEPGDFNQSAADANESGNVDILDVLKILEIIKQQ